MKLKNPKKPKKYYDDRMDTSTQNKMIKLVQKPTNTNLDLDVSSIGVAQLLPIFHASNMTRQHRNK